MERLKEMDEAGIDVQILSHGAPSAQKLSGVEAVDVTRCVNDRLHAVVAANPTRFAAFAALPTSDPKAAAEELERTTKLGFKGAMIHGLANDVFLDDKRFWPIFERAQALDVPLYLHPSVPLPAVMDAYYKDYAKDFPMLVRAAWGYWLVLGGVFDAYPRLKVVLGHLGETLPFLVWRVGQAPARARRR
jgi:predicted TIM-barrel fold metal-dependent hydrolase